MKVLHDWLRDYIGDSIPETIDIEKLFTFHAFEVEGIEKIEDGVVIDVKVLPDRSSDCLCHRGIARELATLTDTPLTKDPLRNEVSLEPKTDRLTVEIENTENCRRFSGALITGLTIKESPELLRERLVALGQRSINNIVDATNYVMLSLGQPLHAYDADTFPHDDSGWHFGVRMAREGETVTTLSNDTYTLTHRVQLITERTKDVPVGIAGVKGGKYAEIHQNTKNIILEAANFDPAVTRRSSQSLKLQTDASKRFENDLPVGLTAYGLQDCVALILEIAGGACEGYVDVYPNPHSNPLVTVALTHINSLLGLELSKETIESILARLEFAYEAMNDGWNVTAPFERTDILIAEDVIAEVGRVYGYEHVASVVPDTASLSEYNARHYYSERVREVLAKEGFSEVITSSFRKKDTIELQNALASDKGCLRSSLRENIREALDRNMPNLDLLRMRELSIFEIGTVFTKFDGVKGIKEHIELSVGVRLKQGGSTPKDDVHISEIKTTLEATLGTSLEATTIKEGILTMNLTELIAKLPVPTAYTPFRGAVDVTYTPFSQYPFISRDIALWCDEGTTVESIAALMKNEAGELLLHTTLFDEFHKEGKVSYAFRLVFQSFERTLTDEEVSNVMMKVTSTLTNKGFVVR